jgi:hypothetical protein
VNICSETSGDSEGLGTIFQLQISQTISLMVCIMVNIMVNIMIHLTVWGTI